MKTSIYTLIISIATLFSMIYQTFWKQSAEMYFYLNTFDFFATFLLLGAWLTEFSQSNKRDWKVWLDLILCVPVLPGVWQEHYIILRFLRTLRSLKFIYEFFDHHKKTNKFVDCCLICITFVFVSAILVFNCEKHVDGANIKNFSDSLWWAMATITTIGYGDRFPVSDLGRLVGGFVMIGGVGLFASFTAFFASKFSEKKEEEDVKKLYNNLVEENKQIRILLEKLNKK